MAELLAPAGNMEALKAAIAVSYEMNQQQKKTSLMPIARALVARLLLKSDTRGYFHAEIL